MAMAHRDDIGRRHRMTALLGLLLAAAILRLPFRRVTAIVATLARGARPCAREEAATTVAAVRHAARWYPGRAACLETSLGAVLAARMRGRRLDWCIGARQLPYAAHAWVEVERQPIGEPNDRPYLLLIRI